jgi:sigma-B regulation protein RsbU (phosphoserine phosphatase)
MANAGLPLPIICRGGKASEQRIVGIPLGLLGTTDYEEVSLPLDRGDLVVMASDGITDNRDRFGNDYGRDRLARLVETHWQDSAEDLLHAIFSDVRHHAADAPAFDDQTAVVVRVM